MLIASQQKNTNNKKNGFRISPQWMFHIVETIEPSFRLKNKIFLENLNCFL